MVETTVVNVRSPEWAQAVKDGTAVYIGRACAGFKASPFGNPWKSGHYGATRDQVIRLYRKWAAGDFTDPKGNHFPHDQLEALRGKVLGCWCAPLKCHGDVLVELLAGAGGEGVA